MDRTQPPDDADHFDGVYIGPKHPPYSVFFRGRSNAVIKGQRPVEVRVSEELKEEIRKRKFNDWQRAYRYKQQQEKRAS